MRWPTAAIDAVSACASTHSRMRGTDAAPVPSINPRATGCGAASKVNSAHFTPEEPPLIARVTPDVLFTASGPRPQDRAVVDDKGVGQRSAAITKQSVA